MDRDPQDDTSLSMCSVSEHALTSKLMHTIGLSTCVEPSTCIVQKGGGGGSLSLSGCKCHHATRWVVSRGWARGGASVWRVVLPISPGLGQPGGVPVGAEPQPRDTRGGALPALCSGITPALRENPLWTGQPNCPHTVQTQRAYYDPGRVGSPNPIGTRE